MISAISSFSALNSNTQIMAASSNASPVNQVSRISRKSGEDSVDFSNSNNISQTNKLPQDRVDLLGEDTVKTGTAYGMDANELRKQSLKNQLTTGSEQNTEETATATVSEVSENNEITEATAENENSNNTTETEEIGNTQSDNQTEELTEEEQQEVAELEARDLEVKTHEQAHLAAAGSLAMGGASYEYEEGPDGSRYAVGGEVSIDTSPGATPEETIAKMQQVKAAAMAPAEPSSQDRSVAASATQQLAAARQEMTADNAEEGNNAEQSAATEGIGSTNMSTTESGTDLTSDKSVQDEAVTEAVSGESTEKTVESGLIEIPTETQAVSENISNSTSQIPKSRLTFQQYAARVAYGIPA